MNQISEIIQKRVERKFAHKLEEHKFELQQQKEQPQNREKELTHQISCLEEKLKIASKTSNPAKDAAPKVELDNYRGKYVEIRNLMAKEIGIVPIQLNKSQEEPNIEQEITKNLKGEANRLNDELQVGKTGNKTTDGEPQAIRTEKTRLIGKHEVFDAENIQPHPKKLTFQYILTRLVINTLSTQVGSTHQHS